MNKPVSLINQISESVVIRNFVKVSFCLLFLIFSTSPPPPHLPCFYPDTYKKFMLYSRLICSKKHVRRRVCQLPVSLRRPSVSQTEVPTRIPPLLKKNTGLKQIQLLISMEKSVILRQLHIFTLLCILFIYTFYLYYLYYSHRYSFLHRYGFAKYDDLLAMLHETNHYCLFVYDLHYTLSGGGNRRKLVECENAFPIN